RLPKRLGLDLLGQLPRGTHLGRRDRAIHAARVALQVIAQLRGALRRGQRDPPRRELVAHGPLCEMEERGDVGIKERYFDTCAVGAGCWSSARTFISSVAFRVNTCRNPEQRGGAVVIDVPDGSAVTRASWRSGKCWSITDRRPTFASPRDIYTTD